MFLLKTKHSYTEDLSRKSWNSAQRAHIMESCEPMGRNSRKEKILNISGGEFLWYPRTIGVLFKFVSPYY
jgi:hypothetical protein